ncbi:MAG: serine aminopeptidase domain-containing protein [Candidatus Xenobiia bacterium LiM19]
MKKLLYLSFIALIVLMSITPAEASSKDSTHERHSVAERFAHDYIYELGARFKGKDAMKADRATWQRLEQIEGERYKILDTVDDPDVFDYSVIRHITRQGDEIKLTVKDHYGGFAAMAVEDKATHNIYIVIRGTDVLFTLEDNSSTDLNDYGWGKTVGRNQYSHFNGRLGTWVEKYSRQARSNDPPARLIITGHSLGGAIAQRLVADHPSKVDEMVIFQAPGVEEAVTGTFNSVDEKKQPRTTLYVAEYDLVSDAGARHVMRKDGKVVVAHIEGLRSNFASHSQLLLQKKNHAKLNRVDGKPDLSNKYGDINYHWITRDEYQTRRGISLGNLTPSKIRKSNMNLSIKVINKKNRKPVADASVTMGFEYCDLYSGIKESWQTKTSGTDGNVTFAEIPYIPEKDTLQISANCARYNDYSGSFILGPGGSLALKDAPPSLSAAGVTSSDNIQLEPLGFRVVVKTVEKEKGADARLSGARAMIRMGDKVWDDYTSNGAVVFFPPFLNEGEEVKMMIEKQGYETVNGRFKLQLKNNAIAVIEVDSRGCTQSFRDIPAENRGKKENEIDITAYMRQITRNVTFTVRTLDKKTRKAVKGAKVVFTAGDQSSAPVRTDESGTATAKLENVKATSAKVLVTYEGTQIETTVGITDVGSSSSGSEPGSKAVTEGEAAVTVPLEPQQAKLSVKVGDKITRQPLPGVTVNVLVDGNSVDSGSTDANGDYQAMIPGGQQATVSLNRKGYESATSTRTIVDQAVSFSGTLQPLLSVTLAGPGSPATGDDCTYKAVVNGGTSPYTFEWYLDGKKQGASAEAVEISWVTPGAHLLKIRIRDKEGLSCEGGVSVNVEAGKLAAQLSGPTNVKMTDKTEHEVKCEGGVPPYMFQWFADGKRANTSAESTSVTITWAGQTPGKHSLEVQVTDSKGSSVRAGQHITLGAEKFDVSAYGPTKVKQGEESTYGVKVQGGVPPYSFRWYLDGADQSLKSDKISVTWANPGTRRLGVVITDSTGARKEIADTITVSPEGSDPVQTTTGCSGNYSGRIVLDRSFNMKSEHYNLLRIIVRGSSLNGTFLKNESTYYGMQFFGQFSGTISEYYDKMAQCVIKGRMRIKGTITGTCISQRVSGSRKDEYPLKGEINGVILDDGSASGTVDFNVPALQHTGHYEWKARN